MIIAIMGLPGAGKTTLATELCRRTDAIHLNGDEFRGGLSSDLGFSESDRIEQARRMGEVARLLARQGKLVVVDFVNPTQSTRHSLGQVDLTVWVDRIEASRFDDTNSMWEQPELFNIRVESGNTPEVDAINVIKQAGILDWTEPTTLMLGRYQPWHEGHQALKGEAHKRTNQVLIGVRNTHGTSEKDPLPYGEVARYIREGNGQDNSLIMKLPNITNIVYGRDVGYLIEQVNLSAEIQAISATQKRKEMGI
jgi:hypothetical protein